MNLGRRLQALERSLRGDRTEPGARRRAGFDPPIEAVILGSDLETDLGRVFCRRVPVDAGAAAPEVRQAAGEAAELAPAFSRILGLCCPETPAAGLEGAAFLDLETTGLCGGTGTYAFLVGLARFDGGRLVVHQLFLRDVDEEPALLTATRSLLRGCDCLVTFNGRTFDWPLLQTRFTLSRMPPPPDPAAHADLLHLARRLWRPRAGSCALSHLEAVILGRPRLDDLPGELIPSLYFDYLRRRDAAPLAPVFEHNLLDLLALVNLANRAARLIAPGEGAAAPPPGDVRDLYGLARAHERAGKDRAAGRYYELALAGDRPRLPPDLEDRAVLSLARLYRRDARPERARDLWRRLAARHLPPLLGLVELAKHLEHREGDFDGALECVDRALELVAPADHRRRRALLHRRGRLSRRAGRTPGTTGQNRRTRQTASTGGNACAARHPRSHHRNG